MRPFDLTGKVAIVTGATKGIGRAMVDGLAAAGSNVVVSSRKQELCDQVAAEVEAATGRRALPLPAMSAIGTPSLGRSSTACSPSSVYHVLVNNAGMTPSGQLMPSTMELSVWRKIFNVNVEGPLRTSQCVAPVMRDQGGGSIINIGSMAAYSGGPGVCAYAASKAALVNLTKSQAREWAAWHVRVNVLSPGPFISEMVAGAERNRPGFTRDRGGHMAGTCR